jgi:membrane protein YdbS with pleckstrin-like domain
MRLDQGLDLWATTCIVKGISAGQEGEACSTIVSTKFQMATSVTEIQYAVRPRWILKALTPSLLLAMLLFGLSLYWGGLTYRTQTFGPGEIGVLFATMLILLTGGFYLQRARFHYALQEKSVTLQWGGFSRHTKEIDYGSIKDVRIEQNSLDKLFGLASLWIVGDQEANWAVSYVRNVRFFRLTDMAGVFGNVAYIPGLNVMDANTLKKTLLSRVNG